MKRLKRVLAIMLVVMLSCQSVLVADAGESLSNQTTAGANGASSEQSATENGANTPSFMSSGVEHAMKVTGVAVNVKVGGNWYYVGDVDPDTTDNIGPLPDGTAVPTDAEVEVTIDYDPSGETFNVGDSIVYQIPQQITPTETQSGNVMDGSTEVGTYTIGSDGKITIVFDNADYLKDGGTIKSGSISFSGQFVEGSWNPDGKLEFGDIDVNVPIMQTTDIDISKSASLYGDYVQYTITVTAGSNNTKNLTGVYVTDAFTYGTEYVGEIYDASADYVKVEDGASADGFADTKTWKINTMPAGSSATLTYKVKLSDNFFSDGGAETRQIDNTATVYSNENSPESDYASVYKYANLYISKSGSYENGVASYTVTVSAPSSNGWTISNVTVEDVFGTGKDYVTSYSDVVASQGTATENADTKTIDWEIGNVAPGETKTLTYKVAVSEDIYMASYASLNNTATLYADDEYVTYDSESISFEKDWIDKEGYLQSDGRVQFIVEVDLTAPQMAGKTATISDVITSDGWVIDTEAGFTVNGSSADVTVAQDAKSWTYEVTGGSKYTIVYYAKYVGTSIEQPVITNEAKVEIDGNEYKDSDTVYGNETFDKTHVSLSGNIASWKTEITTNIPAGTVYTDWNGYTYYSSYGTFKFTDEQIAGITVTGAGEKGTDYVVERVNESSFKVTFVNEVTGVDSNNPITISYSCTLDTENLQNGQSKWYRNEARLDAPNGEYVTDYDECYYTKQQNIDKEAGTYDSATQELTWFITINKDGNLSGSATLEDTLPEGLEFVRASIVDYGYYARWTSLGTISQNGQEITIPVNNLYSDSYGGYTYVKIEVVTKVVDSEFFKTNNTKDFVNTAELSQNGEVIGTDTATATIENEILTKEGVYDKNTAPDIVYTIVVNPTKQDLIDGDKLKIVDTMGTGLMLKTSTLKIVDEAGNEVPIKDVNLKIETNASNQTVFSLELPDEAKFTITYKAYVPGGIGTQVSVSNTVRYENIPNSDTGEPNKVTITKSQATVTGAPYFYIAKKDNADITVALKGAKYALYVVNADGTISADALKTVATNESGELLFNSLENDVVYAFKEIEAPEGYYIDKTNAAYTFVAFAESAITAAMKSELGIGSQNVIQKGIAFERYNSKTEFTVSKTFGGEAVDGTYYIGIFKDGKNVKNVAIEVENGKSEPVTVIGLNVGTYEVYETNKDGERLSVESNVIVVNGTKFEVSGEKEVTLSADAPKASVTIKNTKVAEISFTGSKELTNANASQDKTFTFVLYEADALGVATDKVIGTETIVVTEKNTFTFGGKIFTFTASDAGKTFNYVAKEVNAGETINGIKYDDASYLIKVAVSYSETTGVTVQVTINGKEVTGTTKDGVTTYTVPKFVNKYDAETSITFEGEKVLTGANFNLTANKFSFEITGPHLTDASGKEVASLVIGHNADGSINYPEIHYELADLNGEDSAEFEYTIKEVNAGETIDGITYSEKVYTVTVTVTNTGTTLTAKVTKGSQTGLDFTNVYAAEKDVTVDGTKKLDGAELTEGKFTFVIKQVNGNFTTSETNDANGNFTFELPTYTQADHGKTYTYEIYEVDGKADGFTYDDVVYTVEVTVTDNFDGTLTIDKVVKVNGTKTNEIVFNNEFEGSVTLTKYDGDAENVVLEGAVFELYNSNGKKLGTFTTDANGKINVTGLSEGAYYFVEVEAPAGYEIIAGTYNFVVKPGAYTDVNPVVDVYNSRQPGTVKLLKVTADGTALAGATFALYKQTGTTPNPAADTKIGEYETNANGMITVSNLPWGTYYFVEVSSAPGYVLDTTPTDVIVIDANLGGQVTKKNDTTKFAFEKVDAEGKFVVGATLQLVDKNGVVIDTWTTDGEAHTVNAKLVVGETYTLKEIAVPAGYEFASEITFTVANTADVVKIQMKDEPTEITFTKLDAVGENVVEGAVFEIRDKATGTVVATWESGKEAFVLTGKLNVNTTYVLSEVKAPVGYGYVKDIEFQLVSEVDENGVATTTVVITSEENGESAVVENGIHVFDKEIEFYVNKVEAMETDVLHIVPVEGAEITLFDAEGKEVVVWVSDGENTFNFGPYLEAGKTYTLKETAAPDGYAYVEDITFTVNEDGSIDTDLPAHGNVYLIEDPFTNVVIEKVDEEGNQLPNATLVIKDAETGDVVKEFTTTEEAEEIIGELIAGKTYILSETKAPVGYSYITEDIEFTVSEDGTLVKVTVEDNKLHFIVDKISAVDAERVAGAELTVYEKESGEEVAKWTSDGENTFDFGEFLTAGTTYILKETIAPAGYVWIAEIEFTVNADGSIVTELISTTDEDGNTVYQVENDITKFQFEKVSAETGELLAGAELKLTDSKNNVVAQWVTTTTPYELNGTLVVGETYTLTEVGLPNGYVVAEPITFTVENTGELVVVTMKDDKSFVTITKTDILGVEEIPGAALEIRDKETDELIDSWISTEEAHNIVGKLIVGKTYIIRETQAPVGYSFIPADIEFVVTAENTVVTDAPVVLDGNGNAVGIQVRDEKLHFVVDKVSAKDENRVAGAELTVYDKETQEVIAKWTSDGENTYDFGEFLTAGKTYILKETVVPAGHVAMADVEFTVAADGTIETTLTATEDENGTLVYKVVNDVTTVVIKKVDEEGKLLAGAILAIIDAETNEVVVEWQTDGNVKEMVGKLVAGKTYVLTEREAPEGYLVAADIKFTVLEDTTVLEITMVDKAKPASIVPVTGDDSQVGLYFLLMAISLLGSVVVMKKNKRLSK